ncbi:peptidoglycan-binding domain-containing protein [Arthrobacter pascens]|uniref:peptidoglycan-binding domain-containing protein n=1 Tax=Arthrobacter pascens TaxID=1677 RepID=UPI00196B8C42|nr:peptidoglycan-binding domain-containing protein [Arthrobacter pascens]MBN3496386.1 peptidoglycan-binding protein [Arthrobacter pascens]
MWDQVSENFYSFTEPLEGQVLWMYQDILGKVTIGLGHLIDSEDAAISLSDEGAPFYLRNDNNQASTDQIATEWRAVKSDSEHTGRAWEYEPSTNLRINREGCAELTKNRLLSFESKLKETAEFGTLDEWPADAQLGLLSMAWAMGPAFGQGGKWPSFRQACSTMNWLDAAAKCDMSNAWLIKRNAVNRGLFRNASYSVSQRADPSVLYIEIGSQRPTLRMSDAGEDVASLQRFLAYLGFYVGEQSGQFDEPTDAAVRSFQSSDELTNDGVVGQLTWAALGYIVPRV